MFNTLSPQVHPCCHPAQPLLQLLTLLSPRVPLLHQELCLRVAEPVDKIVKCLTKHEPAEVRFDRKSQPTQRPFSSHLPFVLTFSLPRGDPGREG